MFDSGTRARTHDAQATRQALLRAGARVFAEAGFAGAKVERIAAQAGVNKAMINYHFRGKRGLYAAILGEAVGALAAEIEPLRASRQPADQALRELVGTLGRRLSEAPELPAMLLREILDGGERLDALVLPRMLAVFATTREIVGRGVRRGQFRRVDPALTHLQLIGSLIFFFATARFRERKVAAGHMPAELGPPPGVAPFVAHVQELMTRGLAVEPRRVAPSAARARARRHKQP